MERSDMILLFLGIVQLIALAVIVLQSHEIIGETRALRRLLRNDLQQHQEWLFNQLYTMAPGKVLKPGEIESTDKSMPAKVINPNKDPYAEFKGKKNDWF